MNHPQEKVWATPAAEAAAAPRPAAADGAGFDFDVFISYATDPDYGLARRLESFIETFHALPKPDNVPLEPLRVCVDGSDFKARRGGGRPAQVRATIEGYLAKSRTLLVLCSRNARSSKWVDQELSWFIEHRGRDAVMLALTEGEDLSRLGEVFPPAVVEAGLHEQIAFDFRAARGRAARAWESVRDFEDERARLAADLYGKAAGEILPIWFREQRRQAGRRARVFVAVTSVLLGLLAAAVYFYLNAEAERAKALAEAARARQQSYVASVNFARRAIEEGAVPVALRLLREQEPAAGHEDLRDFDWSHLLRRATAERERVSVPGTEFHGVSVSADGRLFAASGRPAESGPADVPQPVYVWERGSREPRALRGHVGPVTAVKFSPVAPALVSGGRDGLRVWDAASGEELRRLETPPVGAAAFSPDGRALAVAHAEGTTLFDTAGWTPTAELPTMPLPATSVLTFSPDGKQLVTLGTAQSTVFVWEVASRRTVAELDHEEVVLSVAWSAGTNLLATGGRDGAVLIWDMARGESDSAMRYGRPVRALAFSADGKTLAVGTGGSLPGDGGRVIELLDVATLTPRGALMGHERSVTSLAFTPSGEALVSSGDEGAVVVWDVAGGSYLTHFLSRSRRPESSLAFSRDGGLLASGDAGGTIRVRGLDGAAPPLVLGAHDGRVGGLAFDGAGRLVSAGEDGAVRLWEPGSDTSRVLFERGGRLTDARFSPDGGRLAVTACGGGDAAIRLWEGPGLAPLPAVAEGGCASFVAWSPDGQHFATGGGDYEHAAPHSVFVWRVGEEKPLKVLEGHGRWPSSAAFSPDGRQLVTGDKNGELIVWDFAPGVERYRIRGHTSWVHGLAYSPPPAGRVFASVGMDGFLRIWDAATGQERATFREGQLTFNALAFHPGGRFLAAAGGLSYVGGVVVLWAGADSAPRAVAPQP